MHITNFVSQPGYVDKSHVLMIRSASAVTICTLVSFGPSTSIPILQLLSQFLAWLRGKAGTFAAAGNEVKYANTVLRCHELTNTLKVEQGVLCAESLKAFESHIVEIYKIKYQLFLSASLLEYLKFR